MAISTDLGDLKERTRNSWMAGDFGQIARYSIGAGEEFVNRLPISPGSNVLDVACGTGNTAIPAARTGAHVTGLDIAPNLLEQARERAVRNGVTISFDEGDAESLPYEDGQFDIVLSMFGAMFTPRPETVAAELARVCRSGGLISMANWTPESFTGEMFALGARYLPPPSGVLPPVLWGREETARERLGDFTSSIETVRRRISMEFPFPPNEVVQLFRNYFGPTRVAFSRLDPAQQAAYANDLESLWREHNQANNGETRILNEYLEVTATRA